VATLATPRASRSGNVSARSGNNRFDIVCRARDQDAHSRFARARARLYKTAAIAALHSSMFTHSVIYAREPLINASYMAVIFVARTREESRIGSVRLVSPLAIFTATGSRSGRLAKRARANETRIRRSVSGVFPVKDHRLYVSLDSVSGGDKPPRDADFHSL